MKVKETAKKPYGICPASMTIWNADQTYNKKGILGSYALRNNMFDVGAMLLIAVIGYFFLKLEIPIAPIVLALILGPLAESNLRRSLLLSQAVPPSSSPGPSASSSCCWRCCPSAGRCCGRC